MERKRWNEFVIPSSRRRLKQGHVKCQTKADMVAHAFNPSSGKAEAAIEASIWD